MKRNKISQQMHGVLTIIFCGCFSSLHFLSWKQREPWKSLACSNNSARFPFGSFNICCRRASAGCNDKYWKMQCWQAPLSTEEKVCVKAWLFLALKANETNRRSAWAPSKQVLKVTDRKSVLLSQNYTHQRYTAIIRVGFSKKAIHTASTIHTAWIGLTAQAV